MSGGRPSLKTPEVVAAICDRLSEGVPLAQICRGDAMPAYRTVKDWIDSDPEVSAAIACARESGEDVLAAQCLEIADDSRNDYIAKLAADGDEKAVLAFDGEHVQRSRLRVDTRLKLLAKWNPKKYGEKSQIDHTSSDKSMTPPTAIQLIGPHGDGTSTASAETD